MTKRWSDLSPRTRRAIVIVGAIDASLRFAALADLKGRTESEVRGSKRAWGVALAVVSSAGVLPAAYFLRGRIR